MQGWQSYFAKFHVDFYNLSKTKSRPRSKAETA